MAISHCYCYSSYRQINWQIYPPVLISSGQEWQFHIATVTAHIGRSTGRSTPPSVKHRCLEYHYTKLGRSTPLSIEHRCLEYCYTKLGRSTGRSNPHQSSIDALSTITPNLADLLGDLPPSIEHRCLPLSPSTGRSIPPQLSIDALNTTTPNLADLPTQSIEHRCLEYRYTKLGRSTGTEGVLRERPFTRKGNYLVIFIVQLCKADSIILQICGLSGHSFP